MQEIRTKYYKSPVGELIIGSIGGSLCLCDWRYRKMRTSIDSRLSTFFHAEFKEGTSTIIEKTISRLDQYFSGTLREFDIPLEFAGTKFQIEIWRQLANIPYGNTSTYLQLAKKYGNELAIRAVASANGANAISIIVPCHRVIGADGRLTGYAGGLPAKMKLLQLERAFSINQFELFDSVEQ